MTVIICEGGISHNGSLDLCKKMMDAAKWAGADYFKLQKRSVGLVYAGHLTDPRESPWGTTLGDQKRALEFDEAQYDEIDRYSREIGLPWFASAWDMISLEFLRKYDLPYNKIASAMVTNLPFVKAVAAEGKPTFMSTAMCTYDDITNALIELREVKDVTLMHCVGTYPTPEADLNLMMIPKLKRFGRKVGYSGHEASVSPSVIAVAMGAVAIERHITLDRSMYGSDQAASLEPRGFKELVDQIRKIPVIMGTGVKTVTEGERAVAKKLRYWET